MIDGRMNSMKLTEAIEWLKAEHKWCIRVLNEHRDDNSYAAPYLELHAVSGGESHIERFMGQLQDSWFGHRYFHSSTRGGLHVYLIPLSDIEKDEDANWFSLITPRPQPLAGFSNFDSDEYDIITINQPQYLYVKKNDKAVELEFDMRSMIDTLIAKYGLETLIALLNEKDRTGARFTEDEKQITMTLHLKDLMYTPTLSGEEVACLLGFDGNQQPKST